MNIVWGSGTVADTDTVAFHVLSEITSMANTMMLAALLIIRNLFILPGLLSSKKQGKGSAGCK